MSAIREGKREEPREKSEIRLNEMEEEPTRQPTQSQSGDENRS